MPDEILHALTPEEWAAETTERGEFRAAVVRGSFPPYVEISGRHSWQDCFPILADDIPAVIALLLATLPDGHPNKITREDVDALDVPATRGETVVDILTSLRREIAQNGPTLGYTIAEVTTAIITAERVAAKLAALLPPPR